MMAMGNCSACSLSSGSSTDEVQENVVAIEGELKFFKSKKRGYFVLQKGIQPKLQYYTSLKKKTGGSKPKREYLLKDCSSISHIVKLIGLYVNKDYITLLCDSESKALEWVSKLREEKQNTEGYSSVQYNNVWQVSAVHPRGFSRLVSLKGAQLVILNNESISFLPFDKSSSIQEEKDKKEIMLHNIRKCGDFGNVFFLELGRSSSFGTGHLCMEAEDNVIAKNMHDIVRSAMKQSPRDEATILQEKDLIGSTRIRTKSVSSHRNEDLSPVKRVRTVSTPSSGFNHAIVHSAIAASGNSHSVPNGSCKSPLFPKLFQSTDTFDEALDCNYIPMNHGNISDQDTVSSALTGSISISSHDEDVELDGLTNSGHYMEMSPGNASGSDIRALSPSNPIPISRQEGKSSYGLCLSSVSSSSVTSESSELGTPSSTSRTLDPNFPITDFIDPQMRPNRTNSVGSRPEQYGRKHSSPMLEATSISHSWSGTPGMHFKNLIQERSPSQKSNFMLIDYSGKKSTSSISESKEKHTFPFLTSHRKDSSTCAKGSAGHFSSRDKKGAGKSIESVGQMDQRQNDSPKLNVSKSYLPMHPPSTALSCSSSSSKSSSSGGPYLNMSPDSVNEYVVMTQGSSPGSLAIAPPDNRHRRIGAYNNEFFPTELPSTEEPYKLKKNGKGSIRNSFKKKNSEDIYYRMSSVEKEPEPAAKGKPSLLATLSSLMSRKPNTAKIPASQSEISLKSNEEELRTLSSESLPSQSHHDRGIATDNNIKSLITEGKGAANAALFPLNLAVAKDKLESAIEDVGDQRRRVSKDNSDLVVTSCLLRTESRSSEVETSAERRMSNKSYVNIDPKESDVSLPGNVFGKTDFTIENTTKQKNLVDDDTESSSVPKNGASDVVESPIMKCATPLKLAETAVSSWERSRIRSGPEFSESIFRKERKPTRVNSANSSPISYSPATSPTLGSVSSLSEGGLSSASSTGTVVLQKNVATLPIEQLSLDSAAAAAATAATSSLQKNSHQLDHHLAFEDSKTLNYVSLDLGAPKLLDDSAVHLRREEASDISSADESLLEYAQIDFKKSEGLRNTSLERDSSRF